MTGVQTCALPISRPAYLLLSSSVRNPLTKLRHSASRHSTGQADFLWATSNLIGVRHSLDQGPVPRPLLRGGVSLQRYCWSKIPDQHPLAWYDEVIYSSSRASDALLTKPSCPNDCCVSAESLWLWREYACQIQVCLPMSSGKSQGLLTPHRVCHDPLSRGRVLGFARRKANSCKTIVPFGIWRLYGTWYGIAFIPSIRAFDD